MRTIKTRHFTGTIDNTVTKRELDNRKVARRAAAEGMVLLKNEGILPLKEGTKIALYGVGASRTIKGGTGSGDVNERETVSIYQGMKNAGFEITTEDWIKDFDEKYQAARYAWRDEIENEAAKLEDQVSGFFNVYSTTPFRMPAGAPVTQTDADVAIYILSRIAGEGADRFDEAGDYYLTEEEKKQLADICSMYEHVIVAVNTGGLADLSFMDEYVNIEALLQIVQPGMEAGYKLKVYDYPTMYTAGGKRHLREFDIEELLFRKPLVVSDERTNTYYKDKVVLITGGGGSIGSELCRQLAKMQPKKIIILDIYENGAYDVQQELKIAYGNSLDLQIEICSITHRKALERVFEKYHPQIVINAAAHKHVPLMEHNCVEAIYNNVFGTQNLVELCEEYGAERFMMVSTDKAVNPTNVMGATKRMCEMIVQSASTHGKVKYSATRFGNVLGSAGSVIPLFKRQIANGGPVTVTNKRIIRYFMTIPEASQLVLQSGAIANNGELFVLDMGQPVKIMDLAENMIRLSGV